jgi:hypothetical protein
MRFFRPSSAPNLENELPGTRTVEQHQQELAHFWSNLPPEGSLPIDVAR